MSANKRKGSAFETATVNYLNGALGNEHPGDWRYIRRAVQTGRLDVGDVHAWPFVIQNKDTKSSSIPKWIREAEEQAVNAGYPYSVVCRKVRGKGPALAKVHISDDMLYRLGRDSGDADIIPPDYNPHGYWTWELQEFAEVLRAIRSHEGTSPQ